MEKELHKSFPEAVNSDISSPEIMEMFQDFKKIMMMYNCAIKEVRTKFEVLNDEFSVTHNRNPIEMIKWTTIYNCLTAGNRIIPNLNEKYKYRGFCMA